MSNIGLELIKLGLQALVDQGEIRPGRVDQMLKHIQEDRAPRWGQYGDRRIVILGDIKNLPIPDWRAMISHITADQAKDPRDWRWSDEAGHSATIGVEMTGRLYDEGPEL